VASIPRANAIREAAEIIVAGALATTIGIVIALGLARLIKFLSLRGLAIHPGRYLVLHPGRGGIGVLIVLVVSYGIAWLVASYAPGKGARVYPDSAWYGAFEHDRPHDQGIFVTAELRGGRAVSGVLRSFTAEQTPVDDRELTLAAPIDGRLRVRNPNGATFEILDTFIILRGSEILYIAGTYRPLRAAESAAAIAAAA
jgi:Family of unknown function (DUF6338)